MSIATHSPALLALPFAIALAAGESAKARASADAAADASKGPPWISIEYPANPHDRTTRGAFLLVHAFHHGTPVGLPVRGTAEGVVDGKRRTIALDFAATSRPGVYSLRRQWPADGRWMLVITVSQGGEDDGATALVRLTPSGEIASVEIPTRQVNGWTVPTRVTEREIEEAVARLAAERAVAGRSR